jgi:hypothetical protein
VLCDSNILIYAAEPTDTRCKQFVERDSAAIASITRIEVLGFTGFNTLSEDRRVRLQEMLSTLVEIELDEPVIQRAIQLRQQKRMSIADSVVAATALVSNFELVTRDVADFKHIDGLRLINPFADLS